MTVRETEENIEQIFPELSNLIDIINKWLSHGNIDPELAHFIIYLLDYLPPHTKAYKKFPCTSIFLRILLFLLNMIQYRTLLIHPRIMSS